MNYFQSTILCALLSMAPVPAHATQEALRIEISVPKLTYAGSNATLQVVVRNLTPRTISFDASVGTAELDYHVLLQHEDGRPVSKTALGRALAHESTGPSDPAENYVIGGSSHIVSLLPERTFSQNIELSDLYEITRPGRYIVQVKRTYPLELRSPDRPVEYVHADRALVPIGHQVA